MAFVNSAKERILASNPLSAQINDMEELINRLRKELEKGAEIVTYTIVIKRNYTAYTITTDPFGEIYVDEIV